MTRIFLVLTAPTLLLTLASAAPVPTHLMPKDPVCFPTRVGDRMVHLLGEREVVRVVTEVEQTREGMVVTLEYVGDNGTVPHDQTVVASARGLLVVKYAGQKQDPPVWFLKLPHRGGNKWTEKRGNQTWELETVGWEQVTVPAGTFRAIRVERAELSGAASNSTTYWYAPGLGCLKWSSGDRLCVLKSFTPGK